VTLDTITISCCFDKETDRMLKDFRKKGLEETSQAILSFLRAQGLAKMTSLELGCGIGALTIQLLKDGVTSAVGIDLSPKMIAVADSLAADEGLRGSVSFEVGDGANRKLRPSDFVILDTVLCCYPDPDALVDNSSDAARRYFAITIPDDSRLLTRILRVFLPFQRIILRRGGFRIFFHPKKKIVARLEKRGFKRVHYSTVGRIWGLFVFAAPSSG
jgi:SAM-dependent methyltransferase